MLVREGKPPASLSSKAQTATTICQNASNASGSVAPENAPGDSGKSLTEAQVPSTITPYQAYERGRNAAVKAQDAAEAQHPYAFSVGLFIGGAGACFVLTGILGWLASGWPQSVTRIAVLNVFAFLLASWLDAHGESLSRGQDFVKISALHTYFFPQCAVFIVGLCWYLVRRGKGTEPEKDTVRVEHTF